MNSAPSSGLRVEPRRRKLSRIGLGSFLTFAGVSHLTWARRDFQAQVPGWLPMNPDTVVIGSGLVEIALGSALVATGRSRRALVGAVVAGFFVAVFPGNISQSVTHTDAFGLNSDRARTIRLAFQPALVVWALWSTGAWEQWRHRRRSTRL